MGFVLADCDFTAGDFASHIAGHGNCCLVIIGAMPEIDRNVDIFQPEAPGTGEQARIPGQAAQARAECLHLGQDTCLADFGPLDLLFVRLRAMTSDAVYVCGGIVRAAMLKHPDERPPERPRNEGSYC